MTQGGVERLKVLDGWRAVSILAVIAGHQLPLGPKWMQLNDMTARFGMSVFFILSGFLIVTILWRDQHVGRFLIRRVARILPLAWLATVIVFTVARATGEEWLATLFFYANLPPQHLGPAGHFWSLDVEMHFYLGIAICVLALGRRGLWLVPPAMVAFTITRILNAEPASIVTWFRLDDILAGGCLALIHAGQAGPRAQALLARLPVWPMIALLFVASHPESGPVAYARPYIAALTVGSLLYQPGAWLRRPLESSPMAYVAGISYALYVIHPFTLAGWMGEGDRLVRYAKRPFAIALGFMLAHLSTFHFERIFIRWSHRRAA